MTWLVASDVGSLPVSMGYIAMGGVRVGVGVRCARSRAFLLPPPGWLA